MPSGLTRPLARLSPSGKLRVEVPGTPTGWAGDTAMKPTPVWAVTVRLPVNAWAPTGTPQ